MKQGGRGVKTAYKDLKSKLSDRAPAKGATRSTSMASASSISYQHNSAPNSPVFTKRPQSDLISISNSSTHRSKPQKMLQTSNSMINNSNFTNHFNNNINNNNDTISPSASSTVAFGGNNSNIKLNGKHNSHSISKSPVTVSSSPTSSLSSSSEMNILQELQQHALFKLPTVDRSVSFIHIQRISTRFLLCVNNANNNCCCFFFTYFANLYIYLTFFFFLI